MAKRPSLSGAVKAPTAAERAQEAARVASGLGKGAGAPKASSPPAQAQERDGEVRFDTSAGQWFTFRAFVDYYGGTAEWDAAVADVPRAQKTYLWARC